MSSDEKALVELAKDYSTAAYLVSEESEPESLMTEALDKLVGFHFKAVQEAKEEERRRILGLPCMDEEERGFVPWESCETDEAYAAGKKDGRNFLRRELKEEINI